MHLGTIKEKVKQLEYLVDLGILDLEEFLGNLIFFLCYRVFPT